MEILKKIYNVFIDIAQTFLMAASIFLVIYIFILRPFQVSGDSMYPTFKNGEYILTNLIGLRFSNPQRGDVIVFKAPTDNEKDFIKRVIGTGGDSVMLKNGEVFLNGNLLNENTYLSSDVRTYPGSFLLEGQSIRIPEGSYFVMGDNRSFSSDSREWGFLPGKDLEGVSFYVYWPFDSMRLIKNPFSE